MSRYWIYTCLCVFGFISCNNPNRKKIDSASVQQEQVVVRNIPVEVSDTAYRHVDQTFEMTSYVILSNAYESDGLLNLWFAKGGSYYTVFYDLQQNRLIYAGKQIDNIPTKDLLFFYPIRGVYEGNFYSVVPSFVIQYKIAEDSSVFPEDLRNMSADDNSVVAFYKVRR